MCVLGDSTWTDAGGAGHSVMAWTTAKFGDMFGNIPGCRAFTPGGSSETTFIKPYPGITARTSNAFGYDGDYDPPGGIYGIDGVLGSNEDSYPLQQTFSPWGGVQFRARQALDGQQYIRADNLTVEVMCAKYPGQSEDFLITYAPTEPFHGARASGESNVGSQVLEMPGVNAAAGSPAETLRFRSAPFTDINGKTCQQFRFQANHNTGGGGDPEYPQIASIRVLNAANPKGIILDSSSAGGYQAYSWFGHASSGSSANHPECAFVYPQMDYDILMFALGTNDCYNGTSAEAFAERYYAPNGANNRGLIGTLIEAYAAAGKQMPLIVLVSHPFRADDGGGYAAEFAEHANYQAALQNLADTLNAAGHDAVVFNQYRWTHERGMNAETNLTQGLTDRGEYDPGGVAYSVDDLATVNGVQYRCVEAIGTSTADTGPESSGNTVSDALYWRPTSRHLSDVVHWSAEGSRLIAEGLQWFFQQHIREPQERVIEGVNGASFSLQSVDVLGRRSGVSST